MVAAKLLLETPECCLVDHSSDVGLKVRQVFGAEVLEASRSGGLARLESGSGTITIIGTEIARQVADRVRNAE